MRNIFIIILVVICYGESNRPVIHNKAFDKSPEFHLPPVNPEYIKYQEAMQQGKISGFTSNGYPLGYIPPPYKFDLSVYSVLERGEPIPEYYDLRQEEYITSVKDQGNCGACWAFASFGSVESIWLKSEYGRFDFSENNANCGHGFEWGMCDGGNAYLASGYLLRGDGPILESEDPYYGSSGNYISGLIPVGYVTGVHMLPNDKDVIKQAIYNQGALYTTLYYGEQYMNYSYNTYYYSGSEISNHAVTLVGWDDSTYVYGASNKGAWICKNSWGNSWGEDGYFYISYNDTKVNGEVAYWPERKEQFNTVIHQYDELGWTFYSYGWSDFTDYVLVKFDIEDKEKINSIGTWVTSGNATIMIDIYDEFNGTTPSNLLGTIDTKSCPYLGYYTFDLESPIDAELINNADIYVKVKYHIPSNSDNNPIPLEGETVFSDGPYADPNIEQGVFWTSDNGTSSWDAFGSNISGYKYDPCVKIYGSHDIMLGDIIDPFGQINISDIIALIDIKQNQDNFCERCDINSDSKVNVLDVIDLLFIILDQ